MGQAQLNMGRIVAVGEVGGVAGVAIGRRALEHVVGWHAVHGKVAWAPVSA